jgi:hypothetical protein
MFFQIVGWLFALGIMLNITGLLYFAALTMLGEYNIGGVPNTWKDRILVLIFTLFTGIGWYALFLYAPFSINITS